MHEFLQLVEQMPTWQKAVWLLGCLSLGWLSESLKPLVNLRYDKWRHAKINFVFLVTTMAINTAFTAGSLGLFELVDDHRLGLLHAIDLPIWAELLLALLVFDLVAQYGVHVLLHKTGWMWRLHMVHHSDEHVDATTGTRHHPGDYVLREACALGAIVLVGASSAYYLVYRLATVFFTYFTHANVALPLWLDRTLGLVFVTPRLHKFHHHDCLPWTDRNYGNMFSLWDRLFGTLVRDDVARIRYGLNTLPRGTDESLRYQMMLPFTTPSPRRAS